MDKQTHVAIVFPHPDDESFGTAGSIMEWRKNDIPVTYLCGNLGQMGRNMGTPAFANREMLPKIRKQELADACEFLDIDFKLLGYRDKTMEFEDLDKMAEHIKGVLESLNPLPSLVITHYPGHGVHPDHNALGKATIKAVQLMDESIRPTLWVAAITHNHEDILGKPDIVNDVSDVFDKKLEAILKHKTQAEGLLKKFDEQTDFGEMDEMMANFKERLGTEKFYIWQK
ncbi:MAG TPA: bacillithiol biosynthesis deacetylase BshB2 [Bacillota bacterium]|nr:bacillithiol biosynthesis deacetylase BshB2 [Bacillota bacterium]